MEKTGGRPQGWSSLTRQYRDFSLGGGGSTSVAHHGGFSPLASLPYQEVQSRTVPLQQRQAASGQKPAALNPVDHLSNLIKRETQQTQQQIILSRLRERHSWADEVLLQEVLQGVGGIEAVASAQLQSMAPHESFGNQLRRRDQEEQAGRRSSTSTGVERDAGTLPQSGRTTGSEEVDKDGYDGLESSHQSLQADDVPIEPEWEDDDVYSRARREALRMNRARARHARGASNAFMAGDHSRAKKLSREAQEKSILAEKLHAQAAKEIFNIKNSQKDMWTLDLHGLHAMEAVDVLQQHLGHLEQELVNNPSTGFTLGQMKTESFSENRESRSDTKLQDAESDNISVRLTSRIGVKKELTVVTGLGRHSKGGPSLPAAIRTFLLSQGYKLNDTRPGVVGVYPKLRYFRDSNKVAENGMQLE